MNTKIAILSLLVLLGLNKANAQSKLSRREMFLEAESYFLYEEYKEALPLYVQLSVIFPKNNNINYRLGRCYLNIPYEKQKAISYLEDACKNINPYYKASSLKETAAPLDAAYYLGDAYRINNQLEKAIAQYKRFKQISDPAIFDHEMVDDQIRACENARTLEKNPVKINFSNLGDNINSRFSEDNSVVSGDESTIVFSAQLQFYPAVFYSVNKNGAWIPPVNINPDLEVDEDCFPVGLSYDGKELLLYRSNEFLGDLFVSRLVNGKWTKLKKLNSNINTKYWESHACLSHDGKKLYFTSNRKGTVGGLDIYVSTRKDTKDDNWSQAVNLGTAVNSPFNEETPFICADDSKLFFSSLGHNGMGGYDIFVSEHLENGNWGEPQNIGYPLNTTDNDLFYQPVRDGNEGYMALFNPDSHGRNDIYHVKITSTSTQLASINQTLKEPVVTTPTSNINKSIFIENKQGEIEKQVAFIAQINDDQNKIQVTKTDLKTQDKTSKAEIVDVAGGKAKNSVTQKAASKSIDKVDNGLTPGQKKAWHKILYGGLGILTVFVFFILFLYLRSRRQKNKQDS